MAHERDERAGPGRKSSGDAAEDTVRRTAGAARLASREPPSGADVSSLPPGRRRERFLIGLRTGYGAQPFGMPGQSMDSVIEYLNRQEDVEIIKRLRLHDAQPFEAEAARTSEVLVARMDENKAARLRALAPPTLIIEHDGLLDCADYLSVPTPVPGVGTLPLRPVSNEVTIRVLGEREQPIPNAMVAIDAGGLPAQALTDDSGTARMTIFGGSIEAVRWVFVRAAADCWDRLVFVPALDTGTNVVKLRALSEPHVDSPSARSISWGQRLMQIDPAAHLGGAGVKIGLIDSGCDSSHPLLKHISRGKDFTGGGETGWREDLISHGTHCAGIINAANTVQGIVGCVPDAELHVFKVIPGGRSSDLLAALDECIERELDLIDISVTTGEFSELVSQKLFEARQKGIACIVAAGNTGGPLTFPATVPGLLPVGAVGKLREFPPDSSHALSVVPQWIGSNGVFAAGFSSFGPQIAVSAPGVAVISTASGGGYVAADGTSIAAAHVTGFAAAVLGHHPLFQEGRMRMRTEQRVQALFDLVRASAVPYVPDRLRAGAGIPDLQRIPAAREFAAALLAAGSERLPMQIMSPHLSPEWALSLQRRAAGF